MPTVWPDLSPTARCWISGPCESGGSTLPICPTAGTAAISSRKRPARCSAATCSLNPGAQHSFVTEGDILGPSEGMRAQMDYYAHPPSSATLLAKMAGTKPSTLACMHGSAWKGDGSSLLLDLSKALTAKGMATAS